MVIEYWEKNKIMASIVESSNRTQSESKIPKSSKSKGSLFSCASSKKSSTDLRTKYTFVLKYQKENSNVEESLKFDDYSE